MPVNRKAQINATTAFRAILPLTGGFLPTFRWTPISRMIFAPAAKPGKAMLEARFVHIGPLRTGALARVIVLLALAPFVAGHTAARVTGSVLDNADDVSRLVPGSPEHKVQRWVDYQARGGEWNYERWSSVYDHNMTRARRAHKAVNDHWAQVGWGKREVTVDVAPGITRRLDIGDKAMKRGIEHKTGRQFATRHNLWEIARDRELRNQGWDIKWHFEGQPSAPLLRALDKAGIPHNIGD